MKPLAEHVDVRPIERYVPLAAMLEGFWLDTNNPSSSTWTGHRDINAVTLAACLAPEGALG